MPDDKKHALLSASSASRWLNCMPSARMEEPHPDTESEHAAAGTLAHAIAELKLRKYTTRMRKATYETALADFARRPLYDPEMAGTTDVYMDHIKHVCVGMPKGKTSEVLIEHRVDYSHIAPEGFGTADCIILCGSEMHVIDYKHGKGVNVEAEENPQLMLYALGALREYDFDYDIKSVHLTIVQPRNGGIKTWPTDPQTLAAWGESITPRAQAAYDGNGACVTGEWCRFCKAAAECPAQAQVFQELDDRAQKYPDPALLDTDFIAYVLARTDTVANWLTKMREYALGLVLSGTEIEGWKAVEKASRRAWTDQDAAFKALIAAGVDKSMLYETVPIGFTAIEKTVDADTRKAAGFDSYLHKPKGEPVLAPEKDKRPAYVPVQAEDVFKPVDDDFPI